LFRGTPSPKFIHTGIIVNYPKNLKTTHLIPSKLDNWDFDSESMNNIFVRSYNTHTLELENKSEMRKKNTKFFYSPESTGVNVQLNGYFKKNGAYYTKNDRQIKQHFGRAFSSIETYYYERSIIQNGDKLTIKLYSQTKKRFSKL